MHCKIIESPKHWEEILSGFPQASFLHSSSYWSFLEKQGYTVFPLVLEDEMSQPISVCLAYKVRAKRGVILAISHGPLFLDVEFDSLVFQEWDTHLTHLALQQRCDTIRIAPCWSVDVSIPVGWKSSPTHLHAEETLIIDLTLTDEQLLSQMRKTTRQLTKKSIRLLDTQAIKLVWKNTLTHDMQEVYTETMRRGKFVGSSIESIQKEYDSFAQGIDTDSAILAVYHGTTLLSWGMFIRYKDQAYYRHGANVFHREFPAAHLVYWTLFHKAQSLGCKNYDVWGISPKEIPNHPWAAISLFKTGFGGKKKKYAHAIDKPISWKYIFIHLIERVRSKMRGYRY